MIETLKDIAFRIQIESEIYADRATRVETVIKVLSEMVTSYNNYIEIEFLKKPSFREAFEKNSQLIKTIKEDLSLLIVDLNYGSFEAALAPNIIEADFPMFTNEVNDWKKERFSDFKENIINGDYNNFNYIKTISERYSEHDRKRIFDPLFSSFGNGKDYKVKLKDNQNKVQKVLVIPNEKKSFYIPKKVKQKLTEDDFKTYQFFAKVKKVSEGANIKKDSVKQVLYYEELEHDTYPFKPEILKFDGIIFNLKRHLVCEVTFEDSLYFIRNEELDITVWGESRKEVEEAFAFSFYSLYHNYFLQPNEKLSYEAIELKAKLGALINKTFNEDSQI
jgi:hypothetical protein